MQVCSLPQEAFEWAKAFGERVEGAHGGVTVIMYWWEGAYYVTDIIHAES